MDRKSLFATAAAGLLIIGIAGCGGVSGLGGLMSRGNFEGVLMFFGLRVCLFSLIAGCALAQDYPSRPIRMIVSAAPSGTTDLLARMVAARLTDAWKQRIVIDNRPSALGVIAAEATAGAA